MCPIKPDGDEKVLGRDGLPGRKPPPPTVAAQIASAQEEIRRVFLDVRLDDFEGFRASVAQRLISESPESIADQRFKAHEQAIRVADQAAADLKAKAENQGKGAAVQASLVTAREAFLGLAEAPARILKSGRRKAQIGPKVDTRMLLEIALAYTLTAAALGAEGKAMAAMGYVVSANYALGMAYERSLAIVQAREREYALNIDDYKLVAGLLREHCPPEKWECPLDAMKGIAPFYLPHALSKNSKRRGIPRNLDAAHADVVEKLMPLVKVDAMRTVLSHVVRNLTRRRGRPKKARPTT